MKKVFVWVVLVLFSNPWQLFAQSTPITWVISSLQRVYPTEAAGSGLTADISAARGEYESFQIVVRGPAGGLSNVNVTISDLQGPNGQVIPKSAFTLFREHFVQVPLSSPDWQGSNRPLPPGWYPDALIPFNDLATGLPLSGAALDAVPFNLAAARNQPIWVDVLVPRNAQAGQYVGSFTVSSNQGQTTGQISLRVWNFTLPLKPSLRSSFLFWQAGTQSAHEELLRNRLEPLRAPASQQRMLADQFGLGAVGLPFSSGADISHCSMPPAPSVSTLQTSAAAQQPDLLKYVFSADEVDRCTNIYDTLKQWGRNLHQAGLTHLVTMTPNPLLYDDGSGTGRSAIDIWAVLPANSDRNPTRVPEALSRGDKVWSYNALVQDPYSPKWMIDFPLINFRIQPGFINQSLGLTGLHYWSVDFWSYDPWNVINPWGDGHYPGEGMLLYPGAQIGTQAPAPSMRLKALRDGVDDYEYIQILKGLGQTGAALQIARSVGADWTNWTRDPAQVQWARQQLGALIESNGGGTVTPPPPSNGSSLPSTPSNPSPANQATNVGAPTTLAWSASTNATFYEVYLGTSSSSPAFLGATTGTTYAVGTLSAATTYYWRVLAKNSTGNAPVVTWSFVTAGANFTANSAPTADSFAPSGGSGYSTTFYFRYSDANGTSDISNMAALINGNFAGASSCWFVYDKAAGTLWLASDNGSGWNSSLAGGPQATLSNTQCAIIPGGIQYSQSGNTITLAVPIWFTTAFRGTKAVFLQATDKAGSVSGYQNRGTWTIP